MWFEQLDSNRQSLALDLPYINASGSLGFFPDPKNRRVWGMLGAFITNPISYTARKAAQDRVCIPFARRVHSNEGFLLHTGHPNPGFSRVLKKYRDLWANAELPIIVHLMAEDKQPFSKSTQLTQMIRQLESCENVIAIELGFAPMMACSDIKNLVQEAQGELPLIIRLGLDQSQRFSDEILGLPVSMIRLSEPYGLLPDGEGNLISGRLFGPAIFPLALAEVKRLKDLSKRAQQELRVIGGGGVFSKQDASAMLNAGAEAVAFDAWLWHPGTDLSVMLGDE